MTRDEMREVEAELNFKGYTLGRIVEDLCDELEQSGVRVSVSKSDYGRGKWHASLMVEFSEKEEGHGDV